MTPMMESTFPMWNFQDEIVVGKTYQVFRAPAGLFIFDPVLGYPRGAIQIGYSDDPEVSEFVLVEKVIIKDDAEPGVLIGLPAFKGIDFVDLSNYEVLKSFGWVEQEVFLLHDADSGYVNRGLGWRTPEGFLLNQRGERAFALDSV